MSSSQPTDDSASTRKLKILMLHGYAQSGPIFHTKTGSLKKLLSKAFKPTGPLFSAYPGGVSLLYPSASVPLTPADIPGYDPSKIPEGEKPQTTYGWWLHQSNAEKYQGLEASLDVVASTIREADGIDGVIGFSQGGCVAAMVASLFEPDRPRSFTESYPYPASFKALREEGIQTEPLKFCAIYAGFMAPKLYSAFYEPKICTNSLHFMGENDMVVEASRMEALVEAFVEEHREVVRHPGGHFMPMNKDMGAALAGFIVKCVNGGEGVEVVKEKAEK